MQNNCHFVIKKVIRIDIPIFYLKMEREQVKRPAPELVLNFAKYLALQICNYDNFQYLDLKNITE